MYPHNGRDIQSWPSSVQIGEECLQNVSIFGTMGSQIINVRIEIKSRNFVPISVWDKVEIGSRQWHSRCLEEYLLVRRRSEQRLLLFDLPSPWQAMPSHRKHGQISPSRSLAAWPATVNTLMCLCKMTRSETRTSVVSLQIVVSTHSAHSPLWAALYCFLV